mgnify:CR=1 FL=1
MNKYTFRQIYKVTLIALCIASASIANAQQFRFGLFGAPSLNYLGTDQPNITRDAKVFFNFGFITEYTFSDKYGLATGLDFVQRGAEVLIRDTLGEYRSNFLQIPITIKMRTKEYGRLTYFGRFGGSLAFETNERTTITPAFAPERALNSYVAFYNMTLNIGGGVEYNIGGESRLLMELLYGQALFDNLRDKDPRLNNNNHYRFNSFELRMGIIF